MRARRLDEEWTLLAKLAEANPEALEILARESRPDEELFRLNLRRTMGLSLDRVPKESHTVSFRFPELYPALPIEAFLSSPVFHPNVHPINGFVCLWTRVSTADTILEAVVRLQKVIVWELVNRDAEHLMQPEALAWTPDRPLPLARHPIVVPVEIQLERTYAVRTGSRRRLSAPDA